MHQLYVLFESASGYGLFRTTEFEEVAMFMPEVQDSIRDISKFRSIVFLHAFHPFETVGETFDNMQCMMKGKLHKDLHIFLENNVPKSKKGKQAVVLGVSDPALGTSITDTLGIACDTSGVVVEVIRGIRFHFPKLIKGYKDQATIDRSQFGLFHHHARIKLKVKFDRLVPQTVDMSAQLNKDINTLGSRVRRWYSLHFPELSTLVPDVQSYVKCVKEIKNRKSMSENVTDALQDIFNDSEKVQKIVEAARTSMGMDISEEDIENIEKCIEQIFSLMKHRDETNDYLNSKMRQIAPNLSALIGEKVGAQLISQAGSLTSLAKFPASTVQILGAQKSLFRTLKTKGHKDTFVSLKKQTLIGKHLKGRSARYLSNKCSLAARVDCFRVTSTDEYGLQLSEQVQLYKIKKLGLLPELDNEDLKAALIAKKALRRKGKKEKRRQKAKVRGENGVEHKSDVEMEITPSEKVSIRKTKKKRKSKIYQDIAVFKLRQKEKSFKFFYAVRTTQNLAMWMKNAVVFCIAVLSIMDTKGEELAITGKETEEYDEKLSEFIKEILENFREQMPEGILEIGIPPVDPLVIPDVNEDINDNIAKMVLRMRNLTITGISKFHIEELKADLQKGFANFSISLPELTAKGECFMNGKILGIFPISSDGPFFIHVTEVKIAGYGDLNVTTGGQTRLHMNDLRLSLAFGPLDLEFKSLLGGGRWTQVLVRLLTGLGPNLFHHFRKDAMAELNKVLLILINKELDKGTLSELLDQIPMALPKHVKIKFF